MKQNILGAPNNKGASITIDQIEVWGGGRIDHYTLRSQLAYTMESPNNGNFWDMVFVRCRELSASRSVRFGRLQYIQLKVSISFGKETIGIVYGLMIQNIIRMLIIIDCTEKQVRPSPS